jgi:hypothetical protein
MISLDKLLISLRTIFSNMMAITPSILSFFFLLRWAVYFFFFNFDYGLKFLSSKFFVQFKIEIVVT